MQKYTVLEEKISQSKWVNALESGAVATQKKFRRSFSERVKTRF